MAEGVDISSAGKSIIGAAYPHQSIVTIDKDSDLIKKIVDQDTDSPILFYKASEDKLCFMVAQQAAPTQSPVRIVAARPQTNNNSYGFTQDVLSAAQIVVSRKYNTALIGIDVDGVSVESRNVMHGNSSFFDRESSFAADVDNKHNMNNTRYSHHG